MSIGASHNFSFWVYSHEEAQTRKSGISSWASPPMNSETWTNGLAFPGSHSFINKMEVVMPDSQNGYEVTQHKCHWPSILGHMASCL